MTPNASEVVAKVVAKQTVRWGIFFKTVELQYRPPGHPTAGKKEASLRRARSSIPLPFLDLR
jgi:hypothetical protein